MKDQRPMFRSHFETKPEDWLPLIAIFCTAVALATAAVLYIIT